MIYPYKNLLHLPSNGIEYDTVIKIKQLENSIFYALEDSLINKNETEFLASIVSEYMDSKIDITKMYFSDLIYIWNYLFTSSFGVNHLTRENSCNNCGKEQTLKFPISNLTIAFLDDSDTLLKISDFQINESVKIKIGHERRRVEHNIISGGKNIGVFQAIKAKIGGKDAYLEYFSNLIYPQIKYIEVHRKDGEVTVEKKNFKKLLKEIVNFGEDSILYEIYYKIVEEVDFGIMNDMSFKCKFCNHINKFYIVNNLTSSMYFSGINKQKDKLTDFFTFVSTGMISLSEILKIPVSMNSQIMDQLIEAYKNNSGSETRTQQRRGPHGLLGI